MLILNNVIFAEVDHGHGPVFLFCLIPPETCGYKNLPTRAVHGPSAREDFRHPSPGADHRFGSAPAAFCAGWAARRGAPGEALVFSVPQRSYPQGQPLSFLGRGERIPPPGRGGWGRGGSLGLNPKLETPS